MVVEPVMVERELELAERRVLAASARSAAAAARLGVSGASLEVKSEEVRGKLVCVIGVARILKRPKLMYP